MRERLLNRVLQVHAVGVEPRDRVDCAVDVAGCHSSGVDLHMDVGRRFVR